MAADISNPDTALPGRGWRLLRPYLTGNNAGNSFAERYTFNVGAGSSIYADLFSNVRQRQERPGHPGPGLFNADGLVLKGSSLDRQNRPVELSPGPGCRPLLPAGERHRAVELGALHR
jgi:hypothetical protein